MPFYVSDLHCCDCSTVGQKRDEYRFQEENWLLKTCTKYEVSKLFFWFVLCFVMLNYFSDWNGGSLQSRLLDNWEVEKQRMIQDQLGKSWLLCIAKCFFHSSMAVVSTHTFYNFILNCFDDLYSAIQNVLFSISVQQW